MQVLSLRPRRAAYTLLLHQPLEITTTSAATPVLPVLVVWPRTNLESIIILITVNLRLLLVRLEVLQIPIPATTDLAMTQALLVLGAWGRVKP